MVYGPGKPKPPTLGYTTFSVGADLACPPPKKPSKKKFATTAQWFQEQPSALNQAYSSYLYGAPPASWAGSDYEKVARALGFTENEIKALVRCNDSRVPFAVIADLIDAHPTVYSSALTPARLAEEQEFIDRCQAAIRARHLKGMAGPSSWYIMDDFAPETAPFTALYSTYALAYNVTSEATPKSTLLWTPGAHYGGPSLASMLGIWTPPKKAADPFNPYGNFYDWFKSDGG